MIGLNSQIARALKVLAIVFWSSPSLAAGDQPADEPQKGPHGGRLLSKGSFEIEVTIFERGVPPEYRVFPFADGKPIAPSEVTLTIELRRLAGRTDQFRFAPRADFLRGDKVVEEPHSFDVHVAAEWKGERYNWTYDSYEGRTEIAQEAAKEAGITIETVGPAEIAVELPLTGRIVQDSDETIRVGARYPGVVKVVKKRLGDDVKKGDLLAVVEGNASLNTFDVRSPVEGTVTKRNVNVGEVVVDNDVLFEVTNLKRLLVEFHASREDLPRLQVGQPVQIDLGDGTGVVATTVSYIAPTGSPTSQSVAVRASIPNSKKRFVPGLFVSGRIRTETKTAALAVKKTALQSFRDWNVVFLQDGNFYEIRPLELGSEDAEWVEVLGGIEAGQQYVTEGSFVVKADVGKNGATHDH